MSSFLMDSTLRLHIAGTMYTKVDVLISREILYTSGTMYGVLIKEGILISGVVLYTYSCS